MGYSVRNSEWRLSLWAAWNASSRCPDWTHPDNVLELYDHRLDHAAADFDGTELG